MLLVTGFERFGSWPINPTASVAAAVAEALGARAAVLPVTLADAPAALAAALDGIDALLCLGLHGSSRAARVERAALNVADFSIPDNAGHRAAAETLVPGAPDGLLSPVPVRAVAEAIAGEGIPAEVSDSAGTYLCNAVYFHGLLALRGRPVLFLHVPPTPELVRAADGVAGADGGAARVPGMPLEQQVRAAQIAASFLMEAA